MLLTDKNIIQIRLDNENIDIDMLFEDVLYLKIGYLDASIESC